MAQRSVPKLDDLNRRLAERGMEPYDLRKPSSDPKVIAAMNGGELVSIGLYFKLGGTPDGLKAAEAMGEEAARRSELGDPGLLGRVDAMLKPAPKGDKKR